MAEQATKSIIVGAGVDEVFEAWSNFENFPSFMKNIKSVEKRPDGSTHWTMDGPLGKSVAWDAETTMVEPGKRIAWRSREGEASLRWDEAPARLQGASPRPESKALPGEPIRRCRRRLVKGRKPGQQDYLLFTGAARAQRSCSASNADAIC